MITVRESPVTMFQSSPAPKSRCNGEARAGQNASQVSILTGSEEPVQREISALLSDILRVSILTGSEEPVQPDSNDASCTSPAVSILTGSEEPVQPCCEEARGHPLCFNPHRLRRAGATDTVEPGTYTLGKFQSSPAPKSRCNWNQWGTVRGRCMFQSSPAPKSRCNRD